MNLPSISPVSETSWMMRFEAAPALAAAAAEPFAAAGGALVSPAAAASETPSLAPPSSTRFLFSRRAGSVVMFRTLFLSASSLLSELHEKKARAPLNKLDEEKIEMSEPSYFYFARQFLIFFVRFLLPLQKKLLKTLSRPRQSPAFCPCSSPCEPHGSPATPRASPQRRGTRRRRGP